MKSKSKCMTFQKWDKIGGFCGGLCEREKKHRQARHESILSSRFPTHKLYVPTDSSSRTVTCFISKRLKLK